MEPREGIVIIRPAGELDISTAELFSAKTGELLAKGFQTIVLDLRDLVFMDSSGLRAIVSLHAGTSPSQRLQIVQGPDAVQRAFAITGLDRILTFPSAADALDAP